MKYYKHKIFGLCAVIAAVFLGGATLADAQVASGFTFNNNLTVGSTGADVIQLQGYLEGQGYLVMPAGVAKGYFGSITQSALARYQAANGIAPAAGYFGPITRAQVNTRIGLGSNPAVPGCQPGYTYSATTGARCDGSSSGGNNNNNNSGSLSGDEVNLTDFELRREESQGDEGEEEVEVFTAEFDVEDGDIRVERMEIMAAATDDNLGMNPWDYFDRVSIWMDGKEIAEMDVDDRDVWDEENDDEYRLNLTGLNHIVREDDRAEITVAFDIAENIDTDDQEQEFEFFVPDEGIRVTDAEDIVQYIGKDSETVTFGFGAEANGDLTLQTNSDDPESTTLISDEDEESDEYSVFVFDIDNDKDVDALITDLTVDVDAGASDADDVIRRATLVVDGDEYDGDIEAGAITFDDLDLEIAGDDTATFELMVTLVRDAPNATLVFSVDENNVEAEGVDSGDDAEVGGSVESSEHTIGNTGIDIDAVSTSRTVQTPGNTASDSYGTYTIKFKVNALEDNAYISNTADNDRSGNEGVTYRIEGSSFSGATDVTLTSTADTQNGFYVVDEGDSETFTLTVTLNPSVAGTFEVDLDTITFNDEASFTDAIVYTVDSDNPDFQTDPAYIPN